MIEPLMKSAAVATLLDCSVRTVEDHARAGRLPAVKFGDGWMFPSDALLRAINKMAEDEAAKRAQPASPAAVKRAVEPKRASRPNLSLLAQPGG